jgi:predicted nucleotidyltransferase
MIYTIEQLKEKIAPLAHKYNLAAVYIFGSYARGEATDDSDVDVLIDRTGSAVKSLFDMGNLYNDLIEIIGKEIDMVTTHALEQEDTKRRTPWFVDNVKKDMVKIYEKERSRTDISYQNLL